MFCLLSGDAEIHVILHASLILLMLHLTNWTLKAVLQLASYTAQHACVTARQYGKFTWSVRLLPPYCRICWAQRSVGI